MFQVGIILTIVYAVYIDQAFTNIPGFSIAVFLAMCMILLYYHFKLRLHGGLLTKLSYEGKAYIVFYAIIFIPGLIVSPDAGSYLHSIIKGIQYAVLFISAYYVVINKKSIDFIFILLGITIFAYAITAYFNGTIEYGTGRLMISERGNPNEMAVLMYFGFVIIAYLWSKGLIYKILSIVYIPLAFSNIALSGSRKGFIGVALFITLFFISAYLPSLSKKNIARVVISLFVILSLAFVIYKWVVPIYSDAILFERLFQSYDNDESAIIRAGMYRQAFEILREYPLFGVGYDNYKYFSTFGVFSHSTYAEVLSCTGIIGTIIYFSIYISIMRKLLKLYIVKFKQKLPITIEGILISFFIVNLFFAAVRIDLYDPVIYVFFACMAGYYDINKGEFPLKNKMVI